MLPWARCTASRSGASGRRCARPPRQRAPRRRTSRRWSPAGASSRAIRPSPPRFRPSRRPSRQRRRARPPHRSRLPGSRVHRRRAATAARSSYPRRMWRQAGSERPQPVLRATSTRCGDRSPASGRRWARCPGCCLWARLPPSTDPRPPDCLSSSHRPPPRSTLNRPGVRRTSRRAAPVCCLPPRQVDRARNCLIPRVGSVVCCAEIRPRRFRRHCSATATSSCRRDARSTARWRPGSSTRSPGWPSASSHPTSTAITAGCCCSSGVRKRLASTSRRWRRDSADCSCSGRGSGRRTAW